MKTTELKQGDIIFIAVKHRLYREVAKATGSKASHVGIVMKDKNGNWQVAESSVPLSRHYPLQGFIQRSDQGWHCIRRLKQPLTETQIAAIKTESQKRMGKLYHLGFKFDSHRLFCSKFVYEVFQSAIGVEIGKVETFRQLQQRLPHLPLTFWRWWFFGFIPWSRRTLTPASQMNSSLLETIFETND